ncbi:MAG: hypothetical protein ACE10G_09255 [Gemmatimonadales bacterium]
MIAPRCDLLSRILTDVVAQLQGGGAHDQAWAEASRALAATREEDVELYVAIDEHDFDALSTIVRQWASHERTLTKHDRDVLKRALKAFRKRLKIVRLDSVSTAGHGPMSAGRQSSIVGVQPPDQYPQEVWAELARQKRLVAGRDGIYELPPE